MNLNRFAITLQSSRGAALVELALIIFPLLFALGFGSFELANRVAVRQGLVSIAREAAALGFRTCTLADDPPAPAPPIDRSQCLLDLFASINAQISTTLPGAEVVLSMYQYPGASGIPANLIARSGEPTQVLQQSSRYNNPVFQSLSSDNPRLLVSEVYFSGGLLQLGQIFYETAIF